jgi:ABC-type Fe3+-hydroxamate transport system substrate-binding protein
MFKRLFLLICLLMVAAVALAACTPETVEVTRVVTETETITEEVTRIVTEMETVTEEVPVEVTRLVEAPADVSEDVLPRDETLYFNGLQWG